MIRRLAILAAIGLVASAPEVANAQGHGGGGGGYGNNPSVDTGFDEMLQYQMMLGRQQQLRLQQKKALLAKQKGQASKSADSKKKMKSPEGLARTKAKSKPGSSKITAS